MKITPKIRYRYMVECSGLYYQGGRENEARLSRNRSDGKKFNSIEEARRTRKKISGSRIVRFDMLTGDVVDVKDLIQGGVERNWTRKEEEDAVSDDIEA